MSRTARALAALLALLCTATASAAAVPPEIVTGPGSRNLEHVARVPYTGGSDLDIEVRPDARRFLYAGATADATDEAGVRIIEITDPRSPAVRSFLPCSTAQNDVQVLRKGERTYLLVGSDYAFSSSWCFEAVGHEPGPGLLVADVTDVQAPRPIGFLALPDGVHNATLHPAGRYAYVSDAELGLSDPRDAQRLGRLQVVDVADPRRPLLVREVALPHGMSAHDVTFDAGGARAYVGALTQTVILDTSDPANPRRVATILDPAITIHHEADPYAIGERTYLVIGDELAGTAVNPACPGGGLHVYDVTDERVPVKVGVFEAPRVSSARRCTAHVIRIDQARLLLTVAWYEAGTWILDVSSPSAVRAVAWADPSTPDAPADAWAAVHDGEWVYTSDLSRGLDVFRFVAPSGGATAPSVTRRPLTRWRRPA